MKWSQPISYHKQLVSCLLLTSQCCYHCSARVIKSNANAGVIHLIILLSLAQSQTVECTIALSWLASGMQQQASPFCRQTPALEVHNACYPPPLPPHQRALFGLVNIAS